MSTSAWTQHLLLIECRDRVQGSVKISQKHPQTLLAPPLNLPIIGLQWKDIDNAPDGVIMSPNEKDVFLGIGILGLCNGL